MKPRKTIAQIRMEERKRLLPRLYSIWTNIPLTPGSIARRMMKELMDELEGEQR
jgi:hypothetical protein